MMVWIILLLLQLLIISLLCLTFFVCNLINIPDLTQIKENTQIQSVARVLKTKTLGPPSQNPSYPHYHAGPSFQGHRGVHLSFELQMNQCFGSHADMLPHCLGFT